MNHYFNIYRTINSLLSHNATLNIRRDASYLSISLCSILTCNSRSEEFGKDVTQRGQLKTPSRDGGDSGGKDGEVRSKCWRLICSSSLSGLSEL